MLLFFPTVPTLQGSWGRVFQYSRRSAGQHFNKCDQPDRTGREFSKRFYITKPGCSSTSENELFFDDHAPTQILHVKSNHRPVISSNGVKIEGLDGRLNYQEMEPFLITLEPKSGSGERQVVHTGHEMVYCLSGNVEYLIDGKIFSLEPGDFLLFEAHLPHLWRNVSDEDAILLLVLQATGQTAQSVERHFSDYPSLKHLSK